jgi:hypothetical protein
MILVLGCTEGWFTGKRLGDFAKYEDMRRVVNGTDKAAEIARYARAFEGAFAALPAKTQPAKEPAKQPGPVVTTGAKPVVDQPLASKPVDDSKAPKVIDKPDPRNLWEAFWTAFLNLFRKGA